jgi:hypothetical protein
MMHYASANSMDPTTSLITTITMICFGVFGLLVLGAAFYGILVWYPRYRRKHVDALKATGRQGEATILGLPKHRLGPRPGRSSMFTMVPVKLEIRVPGIETYQVEKMFTFPTGSLGLLEEGKIVAVWVDPKAPLDLSRIAIHIDE